MAVIEVKQIPKRVCNIHQEHKAIQGCQIYLTDSDHYYIIYKVKRRDTIKYERRISFDNSYE